MRLSTKHQHRQLAALAQVIARTEDVDHCFWKWEEVIAAFM
jgi:hypothetical protein